MARFFGQHEHALDVKGRVILPVKFRPPFEAGAYLSKFRGGCLALWTPEDFDRRVDALLKRQGEDWDRLDEGRVFSASAERVEVDRQGRLPIAAYQRTFASLSAEVLVIGAIDRVELWNPLVWAQRTALEEARLAGTASPQAAGAQTPEAMSTSTGAG